MRAAIPAPVGAEVAHVGGYQVPVGHAPDGKVVVPIGEREHPRAVGREGDGDVAHAEELLGDRGGVADEGPLVHQGAGGGPPQEEARGAAGGRGHELAAGGPLERDVRLVFDGEGDGRQQGCLPVHVQRRRGGGPARVTPAAAHGRRARKVARVVAHERQDARRQDLAARRRERVVRPLDGVLFRGCGRGGGPPRPLPASQHGKDGRGDGSSTRLEEEPRAETRR